MSFTDDDQGCTAGLHPYGIPDGPAEAAFDELTWLAANACGTETAVIVLADGARPWPLSVFGSTPQRIANSPALCALALQRRERFEVPNFHVDEYRLCASAPLLAETGVVVGALLVLGHTPRELSASQSRALDVLARQVTSLLELRRTQRALEDERRDHERSHKQLTHERNLSDSIINSAPGVFYLFDMSGRFLRWNTNFERVSGYSHEEFAELHPLDLFRGTDKDLIAERIGETFTAGASDAEAPMVTKDGRSMDYHFTGRLVEVDGKPCLIGMGIDVTARNGLEKHLREMQRVESIGQLAAGLAHDFNNILTVIHGQSSRLLSQSDLPPTSREALEQIGMASDRAARLTGQLLTMTRQQVLQMQTLNVNDVLAQMSHLLDRLVGEAMVLDLQTAKELPSVLADLGMLEQVLMNLVINSRDATAEGGRIVVSTKLVEIDTAYVVQHPGAHSGRFVCLSVSDNGSGIPTESLSRIFEPFYTTKDVGKGTGLGLATVFSIVKQHHGFVDVQSEVGRGTIFSLYFPATRLQPLPLQLKQYDAHAFWGSETILVVEDEATVAVMLEATLHDHGYRTVSARNGHEGVEMWSAHRTQIELLITDLVMPGGTSGRDLTYRIWQDEPKLPAIFVSGYTAESIREDLEEHSHLRYLQKPYRPQALLALVREALDAQRQLRAKR